MLLSIDDLWQGDFRSEVVIYTKVYLAEFSNQGVFCLSKYLSSL